MKTRSYWHDNLRLVGICLLIWFVASFGFGILFVGVLNRISFGGFELGFWFAQQGSIYVFVALIFFYAWRMSIVDAKHGVESRDSAEESGDADGEAGGGRGAIDAPGREA